MSTRVAVSVALSLLRSQCSMTVGGYWTEILSFSGLKGRIAPLACDSDKGSRGGRDSRGGGCGRGGGYGVSFEGRTDGGSRANGVTYLLVCLRLLCIACFCYFLFLFVCSFISFFKYFFVLMSIVCNF